MLHPKLRCQHLAATLARAAAAAAAAAAAGAAAASKGRASGALRQAARAEARRDGAVHDAEQLARQIAEAVGRVHLARRTAKGVRVARVAFVGARREGQAERRGSSGVLPGEGGGGCGVRGGEVDSTSRKCVTMKATQWSRRSDAWWRSAALSTAHACPIGTARGAQTGERVADGEEAEQREAGGGSAHGRGMIEPPKCAATQRQIQAAVAAARRKDDEEGAVAAAHVGAAEVGLERRGADELEPLDAEAVGGSEER